jgi:hypothetical protein
MGIFQAKSACFSGTPELGLSAEMSIPARGMRQRKSFRAA